MKKIFIYLLFMLVGASFVLAAPTFADTTDGENCVSTSIIQNGDGQYCDDGGGGGVWAILNIGLTVLTFGVGIAATAGLIICGIRYATSGTNEAQATNARRRIFEIVIGLIAYALLYAALNWLTPGFSTAEVRMDPTSSTHNTTRPAKANSSVTSSNKSTKTSKNTTEAANAREVKKLQATVIRYTWPKYGTHPNEWKNGNSTEAVHKNNRTPYGVWLGWLYSQGEKDCGAYAVAMLKAAGWVDKSLDTRKSSPFPDYFVQSSEWREVSQAPIRAAIKAGKSGNSLLQPGDVVVEKNPGHQHILLYVGKLPGFEYEFTEASWSHFTGTSARSMHRDMKAIYNDYDKLRDSRVWVFRKKF